MTRPAARPFSRRARLNGATETGDRFLAEEVAVALSYSGSTEAVMMASPADLDDFAVGFSLSEGIVASVDEIEEIELVEAQGGIDIQMRLAEGRDIELAGRRRAKAGPVGCGLCGIESIEAALKPVADVSGVTLTLSSADLSEAGRALARGQELNRLTRATHAAAFFVPGQGLVALREDVGRHNALDKLVGHLARNGIDASTGAVIMTSRLSVELIQKTAGSGCGVIAAVSAPTGLAVEMAEKAGMTLVALLRDDDFEIYTRPDRVAADPEETERKRHVR